MKMKCKYCHAEIEQDAQFCTNCGKDLSMFDKCVKCGELLDNDSAFCPYCGTEQPRHEDAEESEERSSYMKIVIAILGVLLLGGLGYYLSSRSNADEIGSTNDNAVETIVTNSKESSMDNNTPEDNYESTESENVTEEEDDNSTEFGEIQSPCTLNGFIDGKYEISMNLYFDKSGKVNGYYYYIKSGSDAALSLNGNLSGNILELFEYNDKDTQTGHFVGTLDRNERVYRGTFTSYKGDEMPFEIRYRQ